MDRDRMNELLEEFFAYLTIAKHLQKELEMNEYPIPMEVLRLSNYLDKLDQVYAGFFEILGEDE